jgi:hypothetical protein
MASMEFARPAQRARFRAGGGRLDSPLCAFVGSTPKEFAVRGVGKRAVSESFVTPALLNRSGAI